MFAYIFIAVLVVAVFAFDWIYRSWRENEWRRKWRDHSHDDD